MANPRKPAVARLSSRRYETPRPADRPEYPPDLSDEARPIFAELVESMPKGAAARSDSTFIGMAATLLAEYRRAPGAFPTPRINALRLMLSELGMTPKARRQLELAPDRKDNPFAEIDRLRGA
ncbi:MAG TPA: hypothetical protein P5032_17255 [Candidatus Competibacter sp.]|nr:hypothetical protein [Candidatus Competibacter sp.]